MKTPVLLLCMSFAGCHGGIFAQETSKPEEITVRGKSFLLQSNVSDSKLPKYRNGASHRLVINGTKLVKDGRLDLNSSDWAQVHAAVAKIRDIRGLNRLLHIQYFFERGTNPKNLLEAKREVKIALADIDVYIACIDGHYRGDDATWDDLMTDGGDSEKNAADQ